MWLDVLRIINASGALLVMVFLLTLPGGPSTRAMSFLTYSLAMYSGAAAYGSIALLGDDSIVRPVMVFVAMVTSLIGVFMVRRSRLGHALPRVKRRHSAATTARAPVRAR